jgi:hypothetical protein
MLLEDVRGQNRNFKSGTGLFRQSEGEKDKDKGTEKVESSFRSDERESGKRTICVELL